LSSLNKGLCRWASSFEWEWSRRRCSENGYNLKSTMIILLHFT